MLESASKDHYQRTAVELGIYIIGNSKLTIFDLTNLIKDRDTYKTDLKLMKNIANNITKERKNNELKLLDPEKLKIEHTKVELKLGELRAEKIKYRISRVFH